MKSAIILALALGVIDVLPPANPEGKLLSTSDATINGRLYPRSIRPGLSDLTIEDRYFETRGSVYRMDGADTVWIARAHDFVSYGTSVSRNEFGINGGLFPSPSGNKLAYYRKDESAVTVFPLLDITSRTGTLLPTTYPMNGMESEIVDLCVYDSGSGRSIVLDIDEFTPERYICAVTWIGEDHILAQILDRSQHDMKLNLYETAGGKLVKTLFSEHNDAWVEPTEPQHPISPELFIYTSAYRDGYNSLYLCDLDGGIRRITSVSADVQYLDYREGWLYYLSSEVSPAEQHLFRISVKPGKTLSKSKIGKPQRMTEERGWHNITMTSSGYTDSWSNFSNPGSIRKYDLNGELLETVQTCDNPLSEYALGRMEFGSVPSADGKFENHYRLLLPPDFDPAKKYPLILYVYGGPHSQMVRDSWMGNIRLWELQMAQKGYVVYIQDNRGTPSHGTEYAQAINRLCGQAEMEDQMVGIRRLMEQEWIDCDRIGVHGWSYGGFMTLSLATAYPEVFKVAVAGGPVIDWKWYEIMYGERYMDTELTNPEGFARTSLIGKVGNLKAKTLICQGAIDNTVVWEHCLSFIQECIRQQVQIDFFTFPKALHNMYGMERVYLYDKITAFFENNL